MRADELIEQIQQLINEHGNCYVIMDSEYDLVLFRLEKRCL